jgi:septum formation protein
MTQALILASQSQIRQQLLRNAGVEFGVEAARVDEDALRAALEAEATSPRDIADALAEMKAVKVSGKHPQAMVIGCDQVLDFEGGILAKPETPEEAREQLCMMRGKRHDLISAAVICEAGRPVWRQVGVVRMAMKNFSDAYVQGYIERNWPGIRHSVGAYKLEEEGVRLFERVDGDYFTVLGLPLLGLLAYLEQRGVLQQ